MTTPNFPHNDARDRQQRDSHAAVHPRVDIFETEESVTLVAEVPGAGEQDTDIQLERNVLTIRANRGCLQPAESEPLYTESCAGAFERTFIISDAIDRDAISATVKDGLLRLHLPKAQQARSRRVAVTSI